MFKGKTVFRAPKMVWQGLTTSSSSMINNSTLLSSSFSLNQTQKRFLNIQEFHSKDLMTKFNIPHQRGIVVDNVEDAKDVAEKVQKKYNSKNLIVKAQILAGGRGKGRFDHGLDIGGVKFCTSAEKAVDATSKMLGYKLTTKQTPKEGIKVQKVFIAECLDFERELYFAILLDRESGGAVIVASTEGGMDIETVAEENPEAIQKVVIKDFDHGPTVEQLNDLSASLGFEGDKKTKANELMKNLYRLFKETDATQIEINPLVETTDGNVACVDAKINFDDNAEFRQKEIFSFRDYDEEDPREVEASKFDLNYVGLDGNIGCMVNGAGLAMGTMDIIKLNGGEPANFLDVGGGATTNQVKEAFKILTSDKKVEAILVNIFGGIMRCDIIAEGIVEAAKQVGIKIPLVVRLSGTNSTQGLKIIKDSGINCITAGNLDDAARLAVQSTKKQ